jgi:hypothetical protein
MELFVTFDPTNGQYGSNRRVVGTHGADFLILGRRGCVSKVWEKVGHGTGKVNSILGAGLPAMVAQWRPIAIALSCKRSANEKS